jgi:hypothetical protein
MEPEEYVNLGKRAILELLDVEHAAAWREIEAKIADSRWPGIGVHIDPHNLGNARAKLLREGKIADTEPAATRGGRPTSVVYPTDTRLRVTAITRAAQRKRLLMSRYLGWAQGTPARPGIVGPAAERVVRASLLAVAPHGYRLVPPTGGHADMFLGDPVPIGPLDAAAICTPYDDAVDVAGNPVAVPIEVKNLREWLYPWSQELYQLLDKAARIQHAHPDRQMVPVLICRKAHLTTYRMARDLGFFVIDTGRQYIAKSVEDDRLQEVRTELGFDLVAQESADKLITDRLIRVYPKHATAGTAERWAATAADSQWRRMFSSQRLDGEEGSRSRRLNRMRAYAFATNRLAVGGWGTPGPEEYA